MPKKNVTWMLEDFVAEGDQCPRCGERRVDYLVWVDQGEQVECQTCQLVYRPHASTTTEERTDSSGQPT